MATGKSPFMIPLGAFYCYGVWWRFRDVAVPDLIQSCVTRKALVSKLRIPLLLQVSRFTLLHPAAPSSLNAT